MAAAPVKRISSPLAQPVTSLWGVGGERAAQLQRLEITTIGDLLLHRPRRHEDRRHTRSIVDLQKSEAATVRGSIIAAGLKRYNRGTKSVFEIIVDDGTARLHCRWWNLPFMQNYFAVGDELFVFGKPNSLKPRTIDHPETELLEEGEESSVHINRIVPVYPLTEGLPQRWLRGLIWRALERHGGEFHETLNVGQASSLSSDTLANTQEDSQRTRSQMTGSNPILPFRAMDKDVPIACYGRHLPHWRQDGATYFVTFRLGDSIPQEKLRQWEAEMTLWLEQHPEPRSDADQMDYQDRFVERFHRWLDSGMGECHLKLPQTRAVVETALRHFDLDRYGLGHFVIMPNHVHVLVRPIQSHRLTDILHSWKSFTANQINKLTGRKGRLWQDESFDVIVRNEQQLEKIAQYIQRNPVCAGLKESEFTLGWGSTVKAGQASRLSSNTLVTTQEDSQHTRCKMTGWKPVLHSRAEAIRMLHFPEELEDVEMARQRLALDEFVELQLEVQTRRRNLQTRAKALPCAGTNHLMRPFLKSLSFDLTEAQTRVMREIRQDMGGRQPMRRLLQGDVGAGKTIVAACTALMTLESGFNVALMAPTEILAEQHFANFQRSFGPLGISVELQTGARKTVEAGGSRLESPREPSTLFIGTHALITQGFNIAKLGLVIIDEQHKFGVAQRENLVRKGMHPHLLVMTATPIPRTLGLTLYGDLDSSIIDQLPPGRGVIKTFVRTAARLPKVWEFVRDKLSEGRQAYVIYPRVEEADLRTGAKAVLAEHERLQKEFSDYRVGLMHGRLKSVEKDEVMRSFRENRVQVLLATSVVEVGVDVPNATVMVIENADQFGLAQLHQLRGRIGRGSHDSFCVLIGEAKTEEARERLRVLEETNDGFKIADADLKLRGPGELLGQQQSGLPPFRFGDLAEDRELVEAAREIVAQALAAAPSTSVAR